MRKMILNNFEVMMKGIALSFAFILWIAYIAIPVLVIVYCILYSLMMNFFATLSSFLPILS